MEGEGQFETATSDDNGLNKFTNLCSELECALANSYTALDELIALKDTMLECNLPSVVKVKLTLAVGRLHRSMSDLSVPTGEMTRLVRLYAVPWENKSKALKKLHQDYESKQHKLEIALRRLELIGVQTMRIEKERRIMNWEKLFAKLVGGKGHGQRWRFFIYQFKQKLKKGEDISGFYSAISDEESDSTDCGHETYSENAAESKRDILFAQELREKLEKYDGLVQNLSDNKPDLHGNEELKIGRNSMVEVESEASINVAASDDNASTVGAEVETPVLTQQTKKKVRFDSGGELREEEEEQLESKSKQCSKEMSDKVCWTHEPEYETFFNIRIYTPICKTLESSWCTVVFDNEIRRSKNFNAKMEEHVFAEEKQPHEGNLGTGRREKNSKSLGQGKAEDKDEFQEFSYKLSKDFNNRNKEDIILKFSVHPANKKKMVAMTTIKLSDVTVFDGRAEKSTLMNSDVQPTSFQIKATVNSSELTFNKNCGVIRVLCFYSKVILPFTISRGTETLSIDELTDRIIELRRKEFIKRLKSAGTSMTEKPIYTEEQMYSAKEELKTQLRTLRDEYEERLSLIISQLNKENTEDLREFVNAATSPLFMWSESEMKVTDNQQSETILMEPVQPSKTKLPKKPQKQNSEKKQKVWGQHLPEDFYERMEMFKEESSKYHQNLKEKINDEIGKEIEKKLASNNRLARSPKDTKLLEEVCLPALYMPTKTRNLYTPKARSYFHAFGTYQDRLTQAPSILELPRLRHDNTDIVGIYESVMKQKMDNLPDHENDTDFERLSPESSTSIEIAGLDNNEDMEEA